MRLYLLIFGLLLSSGAIQAQYYEADSLGSEGSLLVNIHYNKILPMQTFGDNLDRNLSGFSASALGRLKEGGLNYLGAKFAFTHIGDQTQIFVDSDVRSGSNFMSLQLLYRRFTDFYFWRIEPFIDASFGPQMFYTQTTTTFFDDDSSSVDFDNTDFNMAYGVGVGFMIHVANGFFITPKFDYNGGTAVTYLVDRGNEFDYPLDNFYNQTTQTTSLSWSLGISWSW